MKNLYGAPWTPEDLSLAKIDNPPREKVTEKKSTVFMKGPDSCRTEENFYDANMVPVDYCLTIVREKKIRGFS